MKRYQLTALCLAVPCLLAPALPQPAAVAAAKKTVHKPKPGPKPKPQPANQVKGQAQMAGAYGQFGTTYTLKNHFNFTLLSARYTLQPFVAYTAISAKTDEKILLVDIAVKNAMNEDNWFNSDSLLTAVDEKGELYTIGSMALMSKGANDSSFTLKPGQGLGQPSLNDPLQIAGTIPAKARIVKIILNQGRLNTSEDVLRFPIAGATKEEAGVAGDPKNVIAPLPDNVRDPADKSGAVALAEGIGKIGEYVPSGNFAVRLDSFAYTTDSLNGSAPEDGKRYAVATVTAKLLGAADDSFFTVTGGDEPLYEILDTDGERTKPSFYRKAKRDEDPDHSFKQGDEYTFRVVFTLPSDTKAKQLTLGTQGARKWAYDVSDVQ